MTTTKEGIKTQAQTGRNTVRSRAEIKDIPKAPASADEGSEATLEDFALDAALETFCIKRPHHMSEDGDTKIKQLRGAICVWSTLAAESQSSNGLIEFEANAFGHMLWMLEDMVDGVLANVKAGSAVSGLQLLRVDRPYHLSEDGIAKLKQVRGMISVLNDLAKKGPTSNDSIEFDADALFHMLWMLEDKIREVVADAEAGSNLIGGLRR